MTKGRWCDIIVKPSQEGPRKKPKKGTARNRKREPQGTGWGSWKGTESGGNDPWKLNNKRSTENESFYTRQSFEKTNVQHKRKVKSEQTFRNLTASAVKIFYEEFDPGSGWTLAACITHSSRTDSGELAPRKLVADGWVTREQPAFQRGITTGNCR